MPESSRRKKDSYTPPSNSDKKDRKDKKAVKIGPSKWLAPVMVAMFVIGLAWIVIWYIAPEFWIWGTLAGWNVAIGFAFIAVGFILSTRWQ